MIDFYTLLTFGVIHWLADFYFQTHDQATNKSKDNDFLFDHVWTYTIGLFVMGALNGSYFGDWSSPLPLLFIVSWVAINSIAHYFTDYVTSRATSYLFKDENYHDGFVVVGFDQLIHTLTLFGTFIWITNL